MSKITNTKATCLCGSVIITVENMSLDVGACHCSVCRKWSGGPFLAVDCGNQVNFSGKDNIKVFDSSDWAERGFCNQCGTHLFYRLKTSNQFIMPIGIFEGDLNFNFDHQIFIEEKPDYYCFANETKNMTGAEVFAAFSADNQQRVNDDLSQKYLVYGITRYRFSDSCY